MRSQPRSGLALIIVVGVLGLLAALAMAFTTLAQLERRASRQRLHATKAALLARSGIEDALARLGAGQDPKIGDNRYYGEDWDADGSLSAYEAAQEVYRPTGAGTTADADACPVRHALRPSFWARDPNVVGNVPDRRKVRGRDRGYSGALSGGQVPRGNQYALKVTTEGGVYINGGDPTQPALSGDYNTNLRRMLGILAEAVDREDGEAGDGPVGQADGFNLIDSRPQTPRGWESWKQVRDMALGGSQTKLDALRPYLTLHVTVDRSVIRPNAVQGMVGARPKSWAEIKVGMISPAWSRSAPDFERIPVAPGGKLVGRSPVDLAWARTQRPVLIALMAGLEGVWLDETSAGPENKWSIFPPYSIPYDFVGQLTSTSMINIWTSTDDCHRVADYLLSYTTDVDTWEAWNAFCASIPDGSLTGTTDQRRVKRDILKANFNPNSDLNKFNPNASRWKDVDKSDLLVYSTEFNLPSPRGYGIESVGRVLNGRGVLLASRSVRTMLSPPLVVRLGTQREFVCADLGDPDLPGDESAPRLPSDYLSPNSGSVPTWGARIPVVGGQGVSLQTYPEPYGYRLPGTGLAGTDLGITTANYDGNLQLATVETSPDYAYMVGTAVQDMKMLACFDQSLDLESPGSDAPGPNLPDLNQVATTELDLSLLNAAKSNTLYPDGVYSEKDRTPSYHDAGNAHGTRGLMSFWVKANYDAARSVQTRNRGRRYVAWTNYAAQAMDDRNQFFAIAEHNYYMYTKGTSLFFEIGKEFSDYNEEHLFGARRWSQPRRWRLVTASWDFMQDEASPVPSVGEVVLNDGQATSDVGSISVYGSARNAPTLASDITLPDAYGAHRIWLGQSQGLIRARERPGFTNYAGSGADSTVDEFAIYDLGNLGLGDASVTKTFAQNRYKEGRYRKGARYYLHGDPALINDKAPTYLSAPIPLPALSRLLEVAWSFSRPAELPGDYAAVELVSENLAVPDYLWGSMESSSSLDTPGNAPGTGRTQRWMVGRLLPGAFRARVLFLRRPNPLGTLPGPLTDVFGTLDVNTPVLDSPVFDDLTFVYEPVLGRRLLEWEGS